MADDTALGRGRRAQIEDSPRLASDAPSVSWGTDIWSSPTLLPLPSGASILACHAAIWVFTQARMATPPAQNSTKTRGGWTVTIFTSRTIIISPPHQNARPDRISSDGGRTRHAHSSPHRGNLAGGVLPLAALLTLTPRPIGMNPMKAQSAPRERFSEPIYPNPSVARPAGEPVCSANGGACYHCRAQSACL